MLISAPRAAAWATRPNLMTQHAQIAERKYSRPHALNRFALARKGFIAHFAYSPQRREAGGPAGHAIDQVRAGD
jgi:hypothetical protein